MICDYKICVLIPGYCSKRKQTLQMMLDNKYNPLPHEPLKYKLKIWLKPFVLFVNMGIFGGVITI